MERNLRIRYNDLSLKKQFLLKETEKIENEMKVIIRNHNRNANKQNKYNINDLPDIIYNYEIKSLLSISDDVFQQHFLQYLTLKDIGRLDSAMLNYNDRCQYLSKISNSIILKSALSWNSIVNRSRLNWLNEKKLYLKHMKFNDVDIKKSKLFKLCKLFQHCEDLTFTATNKIEPTIVGLILSNCSKLKNLALGTENNHDVSNKVSQLIDDFSQYCSTLQSLDLSKHGNVTDKSIISISKNCVELESLEIPELSKVTDVSIISIAQHCTKLKHLKLYPHAKISDKSIISIAQYCRRLKSLRISCFITDASIVSISTHCTGLENLEVINCHQITDEAILFLSQYCKGLKSLELGCYVGDHDDDGDGNSLITDKSIISISKHCTGLQSLRLCWMDNITDASIISIAEYCTSLESLHINSCYRILDISLITISQHCKGLKSLHISRCDGFSDASIISISQHCTRLEMVDIFDCYNISEVIQGTDYCSVDELLERINLLD